MKLFLKSIKFSLKFIFVYVGVILGIMVLMVAPIFFRKCDENVDKFVEFEVVDAVSYTHLDVYKRQVLYLSCFVSSSLLVYCSIEVEIFILRMYLLLFEYPNLFDF